MPLRLYAAPFLEKLKFGPMKEYFMPSQGHHLAEVGPCSLKENESSQARKVYTHAIPFSEESRSRLRSIGVAEMRISHVSGSAMKIPE